MNNDIIIYAKYDENNSIIRIVSNIFLDNTEGYEEIDRWVKGQDRYLYAHADNGEYVQSKHGKSLYDEKGRPNFKKGFVAWSEEEKEALYPIATPEPTFEELQNDININVDYRLSMLELGF